MIMIVWSDLACAAYAVYAIASYLIGIGCGITYARYAVTDETVPVANRANRGRLSDFPLPIHRGLIQIVRQPSKLWRFGWHRLDPL